MFQARQLFHRSSAPAAGEGTPRPGGASVRTGERSEGVAGDRHPAMRGLDVSPVHGHHCICQRCDQQQNAA